MLRTPEIARWSDLETLRFKVPSWVLFEGCIRPDARFKEGNWNPLVFVLVLDSRPSMVCGMKPKVGTIWELLKHHAWIAPGDAQLYYYHRLPVQS